MIDIGKSAVRMTGLLSLWLLCALAGPGGLAVAEPVPMRVYYIGNSLTMGLRLDRLHRFFELRGVDEQFGSHLSGAKSLSRHWNYKSEPDQKWVSWETNVPKNGGFEPGVNFYQDANPKRFGLYDQALSGHEWDALVLQPFPVASLAQDVQISGNFIDLALRKNPKLKVYIYATWPMRPSDGAKVTPGIPAKGAPIDFQKVWLKPHPGGMESKVNFTASRDYFEKLCRCLNERHPQLSQPVRMVPGGEVLFELDRAIKAGRLPGLAELRKRSPEHVPGMEEGSLPEAGINLLYADRIHLNRIPHEFPSLGVFAVSMAMYATLSGQSPLGLPGSFYGLDDQQDALLIKAVQELVWKVVQECSRASG